MQILAKAPGALCCERRRRTGKFLNCYVMREFPRNIVYAITISIMKYQPPAPLEMAQREVENSQQIFPGLEVK